MPKGSQYLCIFQGIILNVVGVAYNKVDIAVWKTLLDG